MKEDDEGIRFHTLLTVGMHRGGRILLEKRRRQVSSWVAVLFLFMVAACRGKRAGARVAHRGRQGAVAGGATASWWRTDSAAGGSARSVLGGGSVAGAQEEEGQGRGKACHREKNRAKARQ
jgi:hypothetical protein